MFGRRAGSESVVAIIPARLDSTRFPRKALADETGMALVVHVCHAAARGERVSRVVVATDSEEIGEVVRAGGFEAVMTGEHPNGTSRLVEAAELLGLKASEIVVNVQGDEPEIEAGVIDGAVHALENQPSTWLTEMIDEVSPNKWLPPIYGQIGTVASPLSPGEDPDDPNIVKVVTGLIEADDGVGPALYFSRSRIPHDRDGGSDVRLLRHIGIYAYRMSTLCGLSGQGPTPLEQTEKLEQLSWLEWGMLVNVAIRPAGHAGIDTPEQYRAFVRRWRGANT